MFPSLSKAKQPCMCCVVATCTDLKSSLSIPEVYACRGDQKGLNSYETAKSNLNKVSRTSKEWWGTCLTNEADYCAPVVTKCWFTLRAALHALDAPLLPTQPTSLPGCPLQAAQRSQLIQSMQVIPLRSWTSSVYTQSLMYTTHSACR